MRRSPPWWLLIAVPLAAAGVDAATIAAGAVTDLSVTIYRAPDRPADSIDLNDLRGFALISEKRTLSIPAGLSRVRFGGVADGIESDSALISGLRTAIVEKNNDARVLSPSALVTATVGRPVVLVRTNPRTGATRRVPGQIRSDADGGVVFESAEGVEGLRCSGLPETFSFSAATELGSTPTLSVLVRSPAPMTTDVTLSYLAEGFDWSANYVATLSNDAKTMDIGAWVTLANSNAAGFPSAHAQVVAGKLNKEPPAPGNTDDGSEILATCWPSGTTSDFGRELQVGEAVPAPSPDGALREQMFVTAKRAFAAPAAAVLVQEEQLGDLKLYRVPTPTDVSSRQMKQVRLLDRQAVPVELYYAAELPANRDLDYVPARRMLRTRNDEAHHLGLPLPSGRIATSVERGDMTLLVSESPIRDTAVNEDLKIDIGDSPDVQVRAVAQRTRVDPSTVRELPLLPGIVHLRSAVVDNTSQIEIQNARGEAIAFELRLNLWDGTQLISADHAPAEGGARPLFKLTIPANGSMIVHYQTEHTSQTSIGVR
jgi:hypothetical protein